MARDYAKPRNPGGGRSGGNRGSAASRRSPPPQSNGVPGWVWLMLGLAIGLAVAMFVYIGRPSNKVVLGAAVNAPAAAKDAAKKTIPLPPKQPSRFAFYELLPSYEVVIPRENSKPAPAGQPAIAPPPDVKAALAEPGQYLIQVGAYRSREEADKNRASLALIGVESRIEQVTIDQKDTWYRVRIGPEATLAKAQEILDRLESNDIKGFLFKVKS